MSSLSMILMKTLLFVVFVVVTVNASVCRDVDVCITRVREVVAAPRRFWFGEQRAAMCGHRSRSVDCEGPNQLAHFHSIGSRLFRVKTYHSAYLRNLEIFPRITYRASPGHYRACEHEFFSGNASAVEADPDMAPVEPFRIRRRPDIGWPQMQFDDEHVVAIVDVGFATLNFLATGFPRQTKILKEYEPSENFRPSPNPLVVLIFKKPVVPIVVPSSSEDFDLPKFMLAHQLEDHLIGLGLVVVGSDAFAIEKQRLRGRVDNCHSLLQEKLARNAPLPVQSKLPLDELNSWLSVSFKQNSLQGSVCCQRIKLPETSIFLDPLGDVSISALTTLSPPSISSLRIAPSTNYVNYHRHTRNFVELSNELFSLAVVDAHSGHLHWLLVDIPAANLNAAQGYGKTKAEYLPLAPTRPSTCSTYFFLLLSQSGSLNDLRSLCTGMCEHRKKFKIELFKQQHSLRLSALSTVTSCYDLPYAYHILSKDIEANKTMTQQSTAKPNKMGKKQRVSPMISQLSSEVCASFHVSPHHKCPVSSANLPQFLGFALLSYLLFFLYH